MLCQSSIAVGTYSFAGEDAVAIGEDAALGDAVAIAFLICR